MLSELVELHHLISWKGASHLWMASRSAKIRDQCKLTEIFHDWCWLMSNELCPSQIILNICRMPHNFLSCQFSCAPLWGCSRHTSCTEGWKTGKVNPGHQLFVELLLVVSQCTSLYYAKLRSHVLPLGLTRTLTCVLGSCGKWKLLQYASFSKWYCLWQLATLLVCLKGTGDKHVPWGSRIFKWSQHWRKF